jgi:chemotaxis signal transduction protein
MENNKLDLLGFQKELNEQFLEIFESKKNSTGNNVVSTSLGLLNDIYDCIFFISLKDLQNISMNNKFEDSKLLNSWICGFNQIRGETYTIVDFKRLINYSLYQNIDKSYRKIIGENRIVYLKSVSEDKFGLVMDELKLGSTSELTLLFKEMIVEDRKYWKMNEDIDFDAFVNPNNMSSKEYNILKELLEVRVSTELDENTFNKFNYLISDVYLDMYGNRPIFILNVERFIKLLEQTSPI